MIAIVFRLVLLIFLLFFPHKNGWALGLPDFQLDTMGTVNESLKQRQVVPSFQKKELQKVARPLIKEITIRGLASVSREEAMDQIFSRVGEPVIQEKLQADAKAIYALGSFSDVSVRLIPESEGTQVVFWVKENPVIFDIEFKGMTAYGTEEILSLMQMKPGTILNYQLLQKDIEKVTARYHQDGYVLARITQVATDPLLGVLTVEIVEGTVENIEFEGNEATKTYVLRREMALKEGDVLNEQTLSKDLRRIFNLGFYSDVKPRFEPGTHLDKVSVVISMVENRTSSINFGGGFGDREGGFGFIDLTVDNLFGTAQGLLVRGQVGTLQQTYQLRYSNPWFFPEVFGPRTSFTGRRWHTTGRDIFLTDINEDSVRNGWDAVFGKSLSESVSSSLALGIESVAPYGTSTFEAFTSSTVGLNLAYDTRDFWLNPSRGLYYNFGVRQGWVSSDSSNTTFTKYTVDLNQFHPTGGNQTIALHLGIGYGAGVVPINELFFAGGANTVRGYNPDEAHLGTRKLIANAEYRYSFNELLQGVLFYDMGDAFNEGFLDWNRLLTGYGFGIRLNTPLGPIRLDYGVAGGRTFGEGVVHFSIGQAF